MCCLRLEPAFGTYSIGFLMRSCQRFNLLHQRLTSCFYVPVSIAPAVKCCCILAYFRIATYRKSSSYRHCTFKISHAINCDNFSSFGSSI